MTSIPAWEQQDLNTLFDQGMTFGVPPLTLEAIDQAESSGQGGGINSTGYGGFFGLGVGSTYPNNVTVSQALLEGTSPGAFEEQAVTAAAEFSSLLQDYQNNNYSAESAYQTGSPNSWTEGDQVFQDLGVPQYNTNATLTSAISAKPFTSTGGDTTTNPSAADYTSLMSAVSSAQDKLPSGTMGKVLVTLDGYMNPQISTFDVITSFGLSGVEDVAIEIFARALGILLGLGIAAIGAYIGFVGPAGGVGGLMGIQRLRNTSRRLSLTESGQQLRQSLQSERLSSTQQQQEQRLAARREEQERRAAQQQSAQRSAARRNTARIKAQQARTQVEAEREKRLRAQQGLEF